MEKLSFHDADSAFVRCQYKKRYCLYSNSLPQPLHAFYLFNVNNYIHKDNGAFFEDNRSTYATHQLMKQVFQSILIGF